MYAGDLGMPLHIGVAPSLFNFLCSRFWSLNRLRSGHDKSGCVEIIFFFPENSYSEDWRKILKINHAKIVGSLLPKKMITSENVLRHNFSVFLFHEKILYFLSRNGLNIIDIVMENIFRKNFILHGGLGLKSRPFLIYQPTAINQKPIRKSL